MVNGRKQITPRTARELEAAFGPSAEFWLNLETAYRLHREASPDPAIRIGRRNATRRGGRERVLNADDRCGPTRCSCPLHALTSPARASSSRRCISGRLTPQQARLKIQLQPDRRAPTALESGDPGAVRGGSASPSSACPPDCDRRASSTMSQSQGGGSITSVLQETRVFPPPAEFARKAHIGSLDQYEALWNRAKDDPEGFWAEQAAVAALGQAVGQGARLAAAVREVVRRRPAQRVVQLRRPPLRRARTRTRRPSSGRASRATAACCAIRTCSARSSKFANVLKGLGVKKGDVVAVYMPLVPELVIALLACARIGAPHTVIFGGFSAESLAGRIQDCKAKVLVTADGGYRRGKVVPLKENADGAAAMCPTLENVVVYRRTGTHVNWSPGRDHWWHELDGRRLGRLPRRAARQRASALHPLHVGIDRQAQGHPPHHRRLPARHDADDRSGSSTSRTTTPTGARPTSAG